MIIYKANVLGVKLKMKRLKFIVHVFFEYEYFYYNILILYIIYIEFFPP